MLKCINPERDPDSHERMLAMARERSDIHVNDRYLTPSDKDTLTASCDCYVSLHRAEGFGLTLAEAMYLGKPVIATGYSGNLDFMNDENGLLVDYQLVPIGPGAPPYPADGEWADPNIDHAATLMRLVFDDRVASAALGARAAQDIRRTHSAAAAGELMRRRLEYLRGHSSMARDGSVGGRGIAAVAPTLGPRVGRGPASDQSLARGPVRRTARRGALRLMRPFTAYQETVNAEVVRSLESVDDELVGLHERLVRANAMILARLRSQDGATTLPAVIEAHGRTVDEIKDTLIDVGGRLDGMDRAAQTLHALQTDRTLYDALALLGERHKMVDEHPSTNTVAGSLTPFELRVFSQNGEDGILAEILARIGVGERFFVEFGVESAREGNCVYLADVVGWRGLFMECDEDFSVALQEKYRGSDRVRTMRAMVTPENVEKLFEAGRVPPEPDVLSIDVDGGDYWIWNSIEGYRPRVLVIEYNSALDPNRQLVQPAELRGGWDGTAYFGASLGALRVLGERKGYRLVHTELCGVNAFFVREDLAEDRFDGEVLVRGAPNYFQRGQGHPADPDRRRYLDLDSDELVDADQDGSASPIEEPPSNSEANERPAKRSSGPGSR